MSITVSRFVEQFFFAPLEQFCILTFKIGGVVLSPFNKFTFTILLIVFAILVLILSLREENGEISLIPYKAQIILETVFEFLTKIVQEHIQLKNKNQFIPLIITLFFFIFSSNVFGVFPYTYTLTSQLIVTFSIALLLFLIVHGSALAYHKTRFFALFFPSGVSVVLSFLLVPIEFISFIFKPVSMSVRLFANMMAGHALLKVIACFTWKAGAATGVIAGLAHGVTFVLLTILIGLELGVAVVQSGVISILLAIYINDAYNIH